MPLLEISDVRARYGAIEALKGVSLTVGEGEVVTLIGSNGAGKSTTLRSICGLTPAASGTVTFGGEGHHRGPAGRDRHPGHRAVPRGTPLLRPDDRAGEPRPGRLPAARRRDRRGHGAGVHAVPPRLKERAGQKAGTMSGGEQQMLAIGRALMARPRLLLLDEPSLGIAPILVDRIYETIGEIHRSGVAILLVEQNAHRAPRGPPGAATCLRRAGWCSPTPRRALRSDPPRPGSVPGRMTDFRGTDLRMTGGGTQ